MDNASGHLPNSLGDKAIRAKNASGECVEKGLGPRFRRGDLTPAKKEAVPGAAASAASPSRLPEWLRRACPGTLEVVDAPSKPGSTERRFQVLIEGVVRAEFTFEDADLALICVTQVFSLADTPADTRENDEAADLELWLSAPDDIRENLLALIYG